MFISRKEIIILIIFSILFTSCSSTFVFSTYEEANKKIGKRSVEVYLTSGQVYDAKDVSAGKDSTYFFDKSSNKSICIPTNNIKVIGYNNHILGLFEGTALGAGAGYIAGSAFSANNKNPKSGFLTFLLVPFGAAAGMFYGTAIGHHNNFMLPNGIADADTSKARADSTVNTSEYY